MGGTDAPWGYAASIAMLLVFVAAPILGIMSDEAGMAHAISDVLYDRLCDFCHRFGNGWPDLHAGFLHYSELFLPGRPNLLRLYILGREHS